MAATVTRVVILLASVLAVANGARTASAQCLETVLKYQMVFTVFPNDEIALVNYVTAVNLSESAGSDPTLYDECSSNRTTDFYIFNATGNNEFEITINVDKSTLVADRPCGDINDGLFFQWMFRTVKQEGALFPTWDVQYIVPCNFSTALVSEMSLNVSVSGDVADGTPLDISPKFVLQLIDTGGTAITAVTFGDPVYLQLTHIAGEATGMSGYSCRAGSNAAFDEQLRLIDSVGCAADTSILSYGFTSIPLPPFPQPQLIRVGTAQYAQFKFIRSNTVYYQCSVYVCRNGDTTCDDLCANGGPGRRRRRGADDNQNEEPIELLAKITILRHPTKPKNVTTPDYPTRVDGRDIVMNCLSNTGIIATFASLGGLLLITIASAVYVCARSSSLQLDSQKQGGWEAK